VHNAPQAEANLLIAGLDKRVNEQRLKSLHSPLVPIGYNKFGLYRDFHNGPIISMLVGRLRSCLC
jgi:hypothetical protein